jgi:hypothetical protein
MSSREAMNSQKRTFFPEEAIEIIVGYLFRPKIFLLEKIYLKNEVKYLNNKSTTIIESSISIT